MSCCILAGEKREQNWWPFYTAGEIQEGAKTSPYLFLRARTGARTRTIPSTPAGRSLPSPHAPPASACFALAPSLETPTGLLPHACMCPMLTCAAPYAPTLPAGGRGSCPWPSCARLPRSVPHQAPSSAREWRRTTPFTGPPLRLGGGPAHRGSAVVATKKPPRSALGNHPLNPIQESLLHLLAGLLDLLEPDFASSRGARREPRTRAHRPARANRPR
jgi:hypothetical protein